MKQGHDSLRELIHEIEHIESNKKDLIVPTSHMTMIPEPELTRPEPVILRIGPGLEYEDFTVGPVAHDQFSDRLKIPRKYYQRMLVDSPELLSQNVNHWLKKNGENRLVRTLDQRARAILSDRYRPFDHVLLAKAALPALNEIPGIEIMSSQITERRLYIQAVTSKISGEVTPGDVINAGVVLSNSEVGFGAFMVELLLYRLVCKNGMVRGESLRRIHTGKRIDASDHKSYVIFSDEAIQKDNEAFLLKCRDMVSYAFNELAFDNELKKLREANEEKIEKGKINDVVQNVTKRFSLTEDEGALALSNLIEDGNLSKYGMANALTAIANDADDYDRAVELERLGGKVIDLPTSDWTAINRKAA